MNRQPGDLGWTRPCPGYAHRLVQSAKMSDRQQSVTGSGMKENSFYLNSNSQSEDVSLTSGNNNVGSFQYPKPFNDTERNIWVLGLFRFISVLKAKKNSFEVSWCWKCRVNCIETCDLLFTTHIGAVKSRCCYIKPGIVTS